MMNDLDQGKKNSKFTKLKINPGNLLIFNKSSLNQSLSNFKNNKIINFGVPKLRKTWIKNINLNSEIYIKNELSKYGYEYPSLIISVLLGYFGGLPHQISSNIQLKLLRDVFDVVKDINKNIILMLKPHVITDLNVLHDLIKLYPKLNIIITYLHPMVMASHSKFVIANDYTTALCDFKIMGVPTIEYAAYTDEALYITEGGSIRPEYINHFINNDKKLLKATINNIIDSKIKANKIEYNNSSIIFDEII